MAYNPSAGTLVQDFILKKIECGDWKEGTRIWSENMLCEHFSVSRMAVRDAITPLVSMQVLRKVKGSGTYVCAPGERTIEGQKLFPPTPQEIIDLTEFRKMLDVASTQLFIERATDEDVKRLEDCYNTMMLHLENEKEFNKYDSMFHTIISDGTRNSYFQAVSKQIQNPVYISRPVMHAFSGNELAIKYHKLILEAIKEKQTRLACAYMELHIDLSLKYYLENIEKRNEEKGENHTDENY